MAEGIINVQTNIDEGKKMLENLGEDIPDTLQETGIRIAQNWEKKAKEKIVTGKRRNVVTETGIDSFKVTSPSKNQVNVEAAGYLNILDKGRDPGDRPNINNPRFIAAARQYGIDRRILAQAIAQKGTEAYPWIERTNKSMRRIAPKTVEFEINDALRKRVGS